MHKPPQSEMPTPVVSNEQDPVKNGLAEESTHEAPHSATRALPPQVTRNTPRSVPPAPASKQAATSRSTIASITARHLPILVTTFRGELNLDAVRQHDEVATVMIAKALEQRRPVVYVVDARGISMPSAMVRRYWATQVNESRAVLDAMLGTFIVLDNTIVRGALTAILWMTDAGKRLSYVPTFDVALERANALLAERGHARVDISISQRSIPPGR